jgi:hypothetical protein
MFEPLERNCCSEKIPDSRNPLALKPKAYPETTNDLASEQTHLSVRMTEAVDVPNYDPCPRDLATGESNTATFPHPGMLVG